MRIIKTQKSTVTRVLTKHSVVAILIVWYKNNNIKLLKVFLYKTITVLSSYVHKRS